MGQNTLSSTALGICSTVQVSLGYECRNHTACPAFMTCVVAPIRLDMELLEEFGRADAAKSWLAEAPNYERKSW